MQPLPFNPDLIDQQLWRDDPWRTHEQMFDLGISQHMVQYQDYIERALRAELQAQAHRSPLRTFLYNQMSYNNYQNDDWFSMVTSCSEVADMYMGAQRMPVDRAVPAAVDRMIRIRIALNVQRYQALTQWMTQDQLRDSQMMAQDAQVLSREIDAYLGVYNAPQQSYHAPHYQAPSYQVPSYQAPAYGGPAARVAAGQPHPNVRPAAPAIGRSPQRSQVTSVASTALGRQAPAQSRPAAGVGRRPPQTVSSMVSMSPVASAPEVEVYQEGADSFFSMVPVADTQQVRPHQTTIKTTPVTVDHVAEPEHKEPVVEDTIELQTNPLPPLAYFYEDMEMKIEDHALFERKPKPQNVVRGLPVYELREENESIVVEQDWLDTTTVRQYGLIHSTDFDSAADLVTFASAAIADSVVAEFPMVLSTPFFVESPELVLEKCRVLTTQLLNAPSTAEVLDALKFAETVSWRLARDLDRRLTEATNFFLRVRLGLDPEFNIDSFREDIEDLVPAVRDQYGAIVHEAFKKGIPQILMSVRGLTVNGPEEFVQHNLRKILEPIDKSFAVEGDPVRIVLTDLPEQVEPLANLLQDVHQNIVTMVSCQYLAVLPMTLEDTGLVIGVGERRLAGENPSTQEFSDFLDDVDARARLAQPLLHATYVQTCDGALLRFAPNELGFDKLYAVERVA